MSLNVYAPTRDPFPRTPDPACCYLSPQHQAALRALTHGLTSRHGVVVLTGAAGMGKTTLLRAALAALPLPACTTLWVREASLTFRALLQRLCHALGLSVTTMEPLALVGQLQQALHATGRQVVVLLEEAQALPVETLAQLWLLVDHDDTSAHRVQLVLVGQPTLAQTLAQPVLRPLTPYLGVPITLHPLTRQESWAYLTHHLAQATPAPRSLFTLAALRRIVRQGHGVPGVLHRLCTMAWRTGEAAHRTPIPAALVPRGGGARQETRRRPVGPRGLVAAAILGLLAGCLWRAPWPVRRDTAAVLPLPAPAAVLPLPAPAAVRRPPAAAIPTAVPVGPPQDPAPSVVVPLPQATAPAPILVAVGEARPAVTRPPASARPRRRPAPVAWRGGPPRAAVAPQGPPGPRHPPDPAPWFEARPSTNDDGGA